MSELHTVDEFLELLRASGLVEPERFNTVLDWLRRAGLPTDVGQLGLQLVRDGLLTNYQTERLLQRRTDGLMIGPFRILERLSEAVDSGWGPVCDVWLCRHPPSRRRVAIKMLGVEVVSLQMILEKLHREARILAHLDCHPHVIRGHDFDEQDGRPYLVMEFVDGPSLHTILERSGPLPVGRVVQYAVQAARGLQHVHDRGVIHLNVRPEHLLVNRQGVLKLIGLGAARFLQHEEPLLPGQSDVETLGCTDYIVPEVICQLPEVGPLADQYSLGCTLYHLLTGRVPFEGKSLVQRIQGHLAEEPNPLRSLRPDVPNRLAAVVVRMMAKKPSERFPRMADVAAALLPWADPSAGPPLAQEMRSWCPAAADFGAG